MQDVLKVKWPLALVVAVTVSIVGCDILKGETVPGIDIIEASMGPFLIEADQIEGVYRNLDIDSLVFSYRTGIATESEFLDALALSLVKSRWEQSANSVDFIEYRRSFAKGERSGERPDMAIFSSVEVARLSYDPASKTVVVAYVQADARTSVARFEDTNESGFAERTIWPQFNELSANVVSQGINTLDAEDRE